MPLTDTAIRNLKPSAKVTKHSDGAGLHLRLTPNGSKLWRLAYRFDGKQKMLSFGAYPAVTLSDARRKREDAKIALAKGIDPSDIARQEKQQSRIEAENTFGAIAEELLQKLHATFTLDIELRFEPETSLILQK